MPQFMEFIKTKRNFDKSGAVAAEFALISPLLIAMLFALVEYSMVFFTYSAIQTATRDVTRQVAVNTLPVSSAEMTIKSRIPSWSSDSTTVQIGQSSPSNASTNIFSVTTSVPFVNATPLKFFTRLQSGRISTKVEMKQELPFIDQAS